LVDGPKPPGKPVRLFGVPKPAHSRGMRHQKHLIVQGFAAIAAGRLHRGAEVGAD
jgi:hypothetical protein